MPSADKSRVYEFPTLAGGPTAWIEQLSADINHHKLVRGDRGRYPVAGRLAYGFDRFIAMMMSIPYRSKIKPHLSDTNLREYLDYHAFYSERRFLEQPGSFFQEPPTNVSILERVSRRRSWDPKDATLTAIEFYSPFETVCPQFRAEFAALSPNERVESRGWFHGDLPRPTVIFLHGFSAPDYRINTMWFSARRYYEAGLDVVLMNLPLHGSRSPQGTRLHGDAIIHPSMWRVGEATAQGVMDLRILTSHLLQRGAPSVGVMGYSWGGFHASLLACLEPRIDFSVSVAQVVSIADLILGWFLRDFFEESVEQSESMVREIRKILAPFTPLSHQLQIPKDRVLLVASPNDGIVSSVQTELLWKHFGEPRLYSSCGGHVIYFDKKRVTDQVIRFLRDIQVVTAPFEDRRRRLGVRELASRKVRPLSRHFRDKAQGLSSEGREDVA